MVFQLVVIWILAAVAAMGNENARTLLVPSRFPTIQAAIEAASAGDEIVVAPGIYHEAVDFLGKAITVRSSDGPLMTTIDPFESEPPKFETEPCVRFSNSEARDSVLRDFTLTGGAGAHEGVKTQGGGVYIKGASPTIVGCIVDGNAAFEGAGLYFEGGSPKVDGCSFVANEFIAIGGEEGEAEFTDCLFRQHLSAVRARSSASITFERCRVFLSLEEGLLATFMQTVVVTDSRFSENAIAIRSGLPLSLSISGTLFCGNFRTDIDGEYCDDGGNRFLATCPVPEDIDVDGIVGFTDLLDVLASWGLCVACPADIDFSNEVDFADLLSVLAAWGPS